MAWTTLLRLTGFGTGPGWIMQAISQLLFKEANLGFAP